MQYFAGHSQVQVAVAIGIGKGGAGVAQLVFYKVVVFGGGGFLYQAFGGEHIVQGLGAAGALVYEAVGVFGGIGQDRIYEDSS